VWIAKQQLYVVSKWLNELLSRKLSYLIQMDCSRPVCVRAWVRARSPVWPTAGLVVEKCAYACEVCLSVLVMDEWRVYKICRICEQLRSWRKMKGVQNLQNMWAIEKLKENEGCTKYAEYVSDWEVKGKWRVYKICRICERLRSYRKMKGVQNMQNMWAIEKLKENEGCTKSAEYVSDWEVKGKWRVYKICRICERLRS